MPSPEPTVRPTTPADLEAVARIYAHYVAETLVTFDEVPLTVAQWRQRLDDFSARGLPFLVAEREGEVEGFAYAAPWRPKPAYRHTVEDTIYLAPGSTGRGLGGLLLGELILRSEKAGVRQMIAVISETGTDASRALHRRHGFTEAGTLKAVGHKHGRWVDTVLMQRSPSG